MTNRTFTERKDCTTDAVTLRKLTVADLPEVSRVGISSKASWGYAPELMQVFTKELTLEASTLEQLSTAQVACVAEKPKQAGIRT